MACLQQSAHKQRRKEKAGHDNAESTLFSHHDLAERNGCIFRQRGEFGFDFFGGLLKLGLA